MLAIADYLSIAYFLVFFIYFFMAIYLIAKDYKFDINKLFSYALFAFSLWGLGASFYANALNVETAIFYRKISSTGWIVAFAIYTHTIFYITKNNIIDKIKKRLPLLYVIPAVLLYILVLSPNLSNRFNTPILTQYGWYNSSRNLWLAVFVNLYFIIYVFLGMYLLYQKKKISRIKRERDQVSLMLNASAFHIILVIMSEILMPLFLPVKLQEVKMFFTLIPMTITWYSIVKFKFVPITHTNVSKEIVANMNEGLIIINEDGLISSANNNALNLLKYKKHELIGKHFTDIFNEPFSNSKNYFPKKNLHADTFGNFNFSISKKKHLYDINNFAIPTSVSTAPFYDDWNDFIGGCILFSDMSDIEKAQVMLRQEHDNLKIKIRKRTAELNSTNIKLLSEIAQREYRNKWEKLLSKTSSSFITINSSNMEKKMYRLLENAGRFFDIDRAILFLFNDDNTMIRSASQWINVGVDEPNNSKGFYSVSNFGWGLEEMHKTMILIDDVDALPAEAQLEKEKFKQLGIKSNLSLPLASGDRLLGFCSFDSVNKTKQWSEESIKMVTLLTNILVDGLVKVESEEKIMQLAYNDSLTSLPNRFKIIDLIENLIQTKSKNEMFGVLLLDLDSFKNINDSLGHDSGDELIKQIADDLVSITSSYDRVGRFGGDEFVIIIDNIDDYTTIYNLAEYYANIFKKTYTIKEQDFYVTASMGISVYPLDADNTNDLIKSAEIAMYRAKEQGKNQYVISSESLRKELYNKTILTNDLNKAIENNELFLMYQPQVDMKTREVSGVEALIRWRHPKLGIVSPGVFIPLAESSGMIIPIGDWVLKNAIAQASKWHKDGLKKISVAVNLSLSQFINEKFAQNISNLLSVHDFDPNYLELEITESIAMDKNSTILETLTEFKKIGIKIAMDDFGTQYSSLSRIKEMPIDTLKIAMEFVQNLEQNPKNREITNIIISIAQNLNFKLIAEGAETDFQVDYLESKFVDIIQGYYFYKPLNPEDVEKLLR